MQSWLYSLVVSIVGEIAMSLGILGRKLGMTQLFDPEEGIAIPVTVIQAGPCRVTQIKTPQTDGYSAVQIGFEEVLPKRLNKPELGHLAKSEAGSLRHLKEYRLSDTSEYSLGQTITVEVFNAGDLVDISGDTIGRGFAGYQKRHGFRRGQRTHGSKNYRRPGSIGAGTTPGRVYPGTRMAGRMGGKKTTIRKLSVVRVDSDRNLLIVKGAVPGKSGNLIGIAHSNIVGGQKK